MLIKIKLSLSREVTIIICREKKKKKNYLIVLENIVDLADALRACTCSNWRSLSLPPSLSLSLALSLSLFFYIVLHNSINTFLLVII